MELALLVLTLIGFGVVGVVFLVYAARNPSVFKTFREEQEAQKTRQLADVFPNPEPQTKSGQAPEQTQERTNSRER